MQKKPLKPAGTGSGPRMIGKYELVRELGEGGMGVVFEAIEHPIERRCALKMIRAAAHSPDSIRRFRDEAKAMGKVDHENVVPLLNYDEYEGQPYFVMPLLKGVSLEDAIKRRTLSGYQEALRVAADVARGLASIHAAGMIHRDIKPNNIWLELADDGSFRRAKVMDLGISRAAPTEDEQVTKEAGTYGYMSLEQLRGDMPTARADVFSLGVVLYRMLTDSYPFPPNRGPVRYFEALQNHNPPLVASVVPGIPKAVSDLVSQMLQPAPNDRPASAAELAEQFLKLAGGPSAGHVPPETVVEKPWYADAAALPPLVSPSGSRPASTPPKQDSKVTHQPAPAAGTPSGPASLPLKPQPPDANRKPLYEKNAPAWLPDSRKNKPGGSRPVQAFPSQAAASAGSSYVPANPRRPSMQESDPDDFPERPIRRKKSGVAKLVVPILGILLVLIVGMLFIALRR